MASNGVIAIPWIVGTTFKPDPNPVSIALYDVSRVDDVYDRARKCWAVEFETGEGWADGEAPYTPNGYPGLKNTAYTPKPNCAGQSDTPARGISVEGAAGETGDDMEGKFSKISFEVKKKTTLKTFNPYGNEAQHKDVTQDWGNSQGLKDKLSQTVKEAWKRHPLIKTSQLVLGDELLNTGDYAKITTQGEQFELIGVAHDMSYYKHAQKESEILGSPLEGEAIHPENAYKYALFFETGGENRIQKNGALTINELWNQGEYGGMYGKKTGSAKIGLINNIIANKGDMSGLTVTLCPGDEGYIQANKDYPANQDEGDGGAAIYPYIQITKRGEDCTNED